MKLLRGKHWNPVCTLILSTFLGASKLRVNSLGGAEKKVVYVKVSQRRFGSWENALDKLCWIEACFFSVFIGPECYHGLDRGIIVLMLLSA